MNIGLLYSKIKPMLLQKMVKIFNFDNNKKKFCLIRIVILLF